MHDDQIELEALLLCAHLDLGGPPGAQQVVGVRFAGVPLMKQFPAIIEAKVCLFAMLGRVTQSVGVTLVLVDLENEDGEPPWKKQYLAQPPADVRGSSQVVGWLMGAKIPRAGQYRFEVRIGDRVLGARRWYVLQDPRTVPPT